MDKHQQTETIDSSDESVPVFIKKYFVIYFIPIWIVGARSFVYFYFRLWECGEEQLRYLANNRRTKMLFKHGAIILIANGSGSVSLS